MSNTETTILLVSTLLPLYLILAFMFIKTSNRLSKLKTKNRELEINYYDTTRKLERKEREIRDILNNKLSVGNYFYYPNDRSFKECVRGKRAKLIEIREIGGVNKICSKLVDSDGNFIDDILWHGDLQSAGDYIWDETPIKGQLKHNFLEI